MAAGILEERTVGLLNETGVFRYSAQTSPPLLAVSDRKNGAPGQTRTGDPLLRSRMTTLIRTCRSERKARENQHLVINGDKLLLLFHHL